MDDLKDVRIGQTLYTKEGGVWRVGELQYDRFKAYNLAGQSWCFNHDGTSSFFSDLGRILYKKKPETWEDLFPKKKVKKYQFLICTLGESRYRLTGDWYNNADEVVATIPSDTKVIRPIPETEIEINVEE